MRFVFPPGIFSLPHPRPDSPHLSRLPFVDVAQYLQVALIKYAHDYVGEGSAEVEAIPVNTISGSTLALVKEFVAHRATHPFPEIEQPLENRGDISKSLKDAEGGAPNWYREFIARCGPGGKTEAWFDLLRAGEFLIIDDLMNLASIAIATKYLSFSEEKAASLMPVPKETEESRIKKTMAWAEEEPKLLERLVRTSVIPAAVPGTA
jgi:hypothetical protein